MSKVLNVGINGFGRIGRMLARQLSENPKIQITGVNDPSITDPKAAAYNLRYDSVHGKMKVDVGADGSIAIGDEKFGFSAQKDPTLIPWTGTDVVVDCTPLTAREFLAGHLHGSVKHVVKSSPAKGPDLTVVYGVNQDKFDPAVHKVLSNASCTTNCAATVLKIIQDTYGIENGFLDTVHAVTNSDPSVDTSAKDDPIDSRSTFNIKPTSTGAAKAVPLVIPELKGILDAASTRVPVADGSLLTFNLVLKNPPKDAAEVNALFKKMAAGPMKDIVAVTDDPLVNSDIIGRHEAAIIQGVETRLLGKLLVVKAWYDNEAGYVAQLVRTLQHLADQMQSAAPAQQQAATAQMAA
jgi:glyceraldehyde 3-phosphate dehydrogenase